MREFAAQTSYKFHGLIILISKILETRASCAITDDKQDMQNYRHKQVHTYIFIF
jgi:hypothetical protein